jgi:hypothetical protein
VDELVHHAVVTLFAFTLAAAAAFSTFLCHILVLVLFRKHGLLFAGASFRVADG